MKQSVDLMNSIQLKNSMKLMHSRHNNSQSYPTSLARRALLLLCVLLMSVGSAWGQTFNEGTPSDTQNENVALAADNSVTLTSVYFKNLLGEYPGYIRFTAYDNNNNIVEIANGCVTSAYRNYLKLGNLAYASCENQKIFWDDYGSVKVTLDSSVKTLVCYAHKNTKWWDGSTLTEDDGGVKITFTITSTTYIPGTEPSSEITITKFVASDATTAAELDLYTDDIATIKSTFSQYALQYAYVKWYLRDKSTKATVEIATTPFTSTATNPAYSFNKSLGFIWESSTTDHYNTSLGRYWNEGGPDGTEWHDAILQKVFKVNYTVPTGKTIKDYEVVCVIADSENLTVDPSNPLILTEPTFKLKFVYRFMTVSDLDDAFTAGDDSSAETVNKVIEHNDTQASVNLNNYMDEICSKLSITKDDAGLSDFYLRWYLVKNGTAVEDKATYSTGGKLLSFDSNYDSSSPNLFLNKKEGKIFYETLHSGSYISDFTNKDKQGPKNVTFTLPSGDSWSEYKIVCVMTDAAAANGVDAGDGGSTFHGVSITNDVLITEPTIKLKYVFGMKTEEEIKALFTASEGATTKLTSAYQGVKLLTDATSTSIDVNLASTDIFADWSKTNAFGDDDETDQFVYARFLLVDKSGSPIDMTSYTLTCNGTPGTGVYTQTLSNNQLVIYAPVSGFAESLMNIRVATTGTPDWTNVRLAAVISNDATGLSTANDMNYYTDAGKLGNETQYMVINEPSNFYSAWTCKFITDAEDYFIEGNQTNIKSRTVYQLKTDATTFTVDLNKFAYTIAKDFGKTNLSGISNFYLRWYIADRTTGDYIEDAGTMISMKDYLSGADVQVAQKYGLIWASNMSGAGGLGENVLNATVTLPSGYTQDNVKLVCLMTDDLTGLGGAKSGLTISSDPTTLKWKYNVEFITEEEAASLVNGNYSYITSTPSEIVTTHTTVVDTDTEADMEEALTTLLATTTLSAPKYLRLYVTDLKGKTLDASSAFSSTTVTYQNVGRAGAVWTGDTWSAGALQAVFSKANLSTTDWTALRVVCDLTDDMTGSYKVGDVLMEQPATMKARLIVTFKKSKDHYSSQEAVDYTSGQTIQHQNYATGTVNLDLSTATDFATINGYFSNKLAAGETVNNFYIRWYLADEDGDRVIPIPSGITLTPKEGSGLAAFNYTNPDLTVDEIGQMWYSGDAASFNMDVLKMDVNVTNASVNLNDYQIICVMTTFDGAGGVTYDPSTGFSREPNLNVKFVYDFNSEWDGSLISDPYRHSKEILIPSSTETQALIPLNLSYGKILTEYGTTGGELATHFHVRWYVEKKNGTAWEKVANSESCLAPIAANSGKQAPVISDKYHYSEPGYGIFWNTEMNMNAEEATHPKLTAPVSDEDAFDSDNVKNWLNMTFTKPDDTDWHDYRVVVVMSDHVSDGGMTSEIVKEEMTTWNPGTAWEETKVSKRITRFTYTNGQVWELTENFNEHGNRTSYLVDMVHEPKKLNMVYYYNFFVQDNFKFVHYNGASERDLMKKDDKNTKGTKYLSGSQTMAATVAQYYWNNDNSERVLSSVDVRQGVHTVEYTIYVDTSTGAAAVPLKLGLEKFFDSSGGSVEPSAYFRWYDWTTDLGSDRLTAVGTDLVEYKDNDTNNSRGFFMLNNSDAGYFPKSSNVGVTFNPVGMADETIIACDVSKYYDGIYTGSAGEYLMHEPTLSVRYMFHILPANTCVTKINTGASTLQQAISDLQTGAKTYYDTKNGTSVTAGTRNTMFRQLLENNGRTIVSIKDANSQFVTRANLPELGDYYLPTAIGGDQTPVQANTIKWYAYFEDENGLWYNSTPLVTSAWDSQQNLRINAFNLASLGGSYTLLSPAGTVKTVTPQAGQRYHLVGCLSNSTNASYEVPVCYYDMRFVNAPAYQLSDLYSQTDLVNRRDEYLEAHLTKAGKTLNFDDINNGLVTTLASQADNQTEMPLDWTEAHYGFCYPQLDSYRIRQGNNDPYGMTPLHGEYILAKSMNDPNVSATTPYKYHWWNSAVLHDVTYQKAVEQGSSDIEYGSFLYVDASDESRTISTLDFDASLCAGSEIHFTMHMADMTEGGKLSPQVMVHVYGLGASGRTHVISFLSSELNTVANSSYEYGKWYQIYGHGTIPDNIDITQFSSYEVDIDNYSRHTNGADYCVDQITFYTNTAQVKIKQVDASCTDDMVKMSVYMSAENLKETALGVSDVQQNLFWRICDEDGNVVKGTGLYSNSDDGTMAYGTALITTNYQLDSNGNLTTPFVNEGFFKGEDGNVYFYLVNNKGIPLTEDKQYYVSIYNISSGIETSEPTNEALWGTPNSTCTVCSDMFGAQKMKVSFLDGDLAATPTVSSGCGSSGNPSISYNIVLKMPDSTEPTGFKTFNTVHFDFFMGSRVQYDAITNLKEALDDYRYYYPSYEGLNPEYQSQNATYYNIINANLSSLILSASTTFNYTFTQPGLNEFVAEAIETTTSGYVVCSPISFSFRYIASGPQLALGFPDVTYPSSGYEKRVVRVGLEQLDNLKGDFKLHVPVHSFKDNNQTTTGTIYFYGNDITLTGTNDPTATTGTTVATLQTIDTGEGRPAVNTDHQYLELDFETPGVTFHEGYQYELHTVYYDKTDDVSGTPDAEACKIDLYFILKVVPKYVTWNDGSVTPNSNQNTNWNNDANWSRSKKAELYSTTYQDNTDISSSLDPTPATYVPMKFTYVTIPTGNKAPSLINLTTSSNGIYTNIGSDATANIQYDMMVRYTEKTCQGGYTGHTVVSGDIYDCEKFYGNWAKEIYFKPSAELINQQYLTYEKAWVEKQLTPNTWYLMAAPLKATYAGDMYVPKADGLQDTEAFTDISFNTTDYSRAKYPVYQHSWGTAFGSSIYVKTDNPHANLYSGNLNFSSISSIESTNALWGHTFNDVQVPYTTRTAFAIRAHKKGIEASTNHAAAALLRLPKADTSYDYYQWDETTPDPAAGTDIKTVTKATADYAKLLTDNTAPVTIDSKPVTFGVVYGTQARTAGDGNITTALSDLQVIDDYYLVGNPYMASLDVKKFLTGNASLDQRVWTYEGSTATAATTGIIRPLQGFFVKKVTATEISFTPDMMMDGNTGTPTSAPQLTQALTLTAKNEKGQSVATVSQEEGQNVETLFDSNLAEVPMVYTVADGKAVSIHHLTADVEAVCFGVTCSGDEAVDVTLQGVDNMGEIRYVFDAADGSTTEVSEGDVLSIVPNEYGRYFLTSKNSTTGMKDEVAAGIRVSVHGGVVKVSAAQPLGTVRVVSVSGATMYHETNCGKAIQFQLQQGIYVVETDGPSGKHTTKIFVK